MHIHDIINKISKSTEFEKSEFQGEEVTLNMPFEEKEGGKELAVFARTSQNDVVKLRFLSGSDIDQLSNKNFSDSLSESYRCEIVKDKSTPSFWMCRALSSGETSFSDHAFFTDIAFDDKTKRVKTVRDGYQEYLGQELGLEPFDKIFTVYRSPETISAMSPQMNNLPVIEDHIDPATTPHETAVLGRLSDTEIIEFNGDFKDSTQYLDSAIPMAGDIQTLKDSGKKQFSLGYMAKTKDHPVYDLEQYEMKATHIAIVDVARGGCMLTFVDAVTEARDLEIINNKKGNTMKAIDEAIKELKGMSDEDKKTAIGKMKDAGFFGTKSEEKEGGKKGDAQESLNSEKDKKDSKEKAKKDESEGGKKGDAQIALNADHDKEKKFGDEMTFSENMSLMKKVDGYLKKDFTSFEDSKSAAVAVLKHVYGQEKTFEDAEISTLIKHCPMPSERITITKEFTDSETKKPDTLLSQLSGVKAGAL